MSLYLLALATTAGWAALLVGAGSVVSFGQRCGSWLEDGSLRLATGLAVLPMVPIAMHELAGIRVSAVTAVLVGGLGLALLGLELRRGGGPASPPAPRGRDLALGLIAVGVLFACLRGALLEPGFEGRDPWGHALGLAYVADTGSLRQPFPDWPLLDYVDGYPPLYDVLMAVPCQWSGSIHVTLKVANALVVGLVNVVLFLLARRLTGDETRAMVATVAFALAPGNLTRHPWGHSVAVVLLLAGLVWALETRGGWRRLVPCGCCFAGALLAAPSQGITAGIVLALSAAVALVGERRWALRLAAAGALALVLAAVWMVPVAVRYGVEPASLMRSMQPAAVRRLDPERLRAELREKGLDDALPAPYDDSARARYGLDDLLLFRPHRFAVERSGGKRLERVVPTGLGIPIVVLSLVFIAVAVATRPGARKEQGWRPLGLVWLSFAALGTFGAHLGLPFFAWRFWLMLNPFAALAAADGLVWAVEAWRGSARARAAALMVVALCAGALALAAWSDLTRSRILRYWPLNPAFAVVVAAAAWWSWRHLRDGVGSSSGWSARQRVAAALLLLALAGVAAPIRARALTGYVAPKGFFDPLEHEGYLAVWRATGHGAAVFPLSGEGRDRFLVGLDRRCQLWRGDQRAFSRRLVGPDPPDAAELVSWLAANGYRYLVADPSFADLLAQQPGTGTFAARVADLERHPGLEKILDLSARGSPSRLVLFGLRSSRPAGP